MFGRFYLFIFLKLPNQAGPSDKDYTEQTSKDQSHLELQLMAAHMNCIYYLNFAQSQ